MKIAISGKGGVGKTTLTAMLAAAWSLRDRGVIALDADPDANLASALSIPLDRQPIPLSEMHELIAERTGSAEAYGGYFKLNPKVDDIPEKYAVRIGNIHLLALGGVKAGGAGCICPATALVKALLTHLILGRDQAILMDMEAGSEHVGRATAQSMDALLVVVDEGLWSLQTARRVRKLAGDLGMTRLLAVANGVKPSTDLETIRNALEDIPLIGQIPYEERFRAGLVRLGEEQTLEPTEALAQHLPEIEQLLETIENSIEAS